MLANTTPQRIPRTPVDGVSRVPYGLLVVLILLGLLAAANSPQCH
jgi:hypothetical protein